MTILSGGVRRKQAGRQAGRMQDAGRFSERRHKATFNILPYYHYHSLFSMVIRDGN
jgi:hypothetical protein